jgi:ferric-dicitrate binding protein FerR (iron transport regulator)
MATGNGGWGNQAPDVPGALAEYIDALPSGEPLDREPRDSGERRRRMVPYLRAHAAREHVRARRRRVVRRAALLFSTVGAAAVVLVAFTGVLRPGATRAGAQIAVLDGTLWLDEGEARRALRAGEASGVDATDVLEAPAEQATRVQLSDTATLTLDPASRAGTIVADATVTTADYAPAFEAVRLVRGRAHLKVRKLHGGQRFHVLTPDADVQVRGTEFDVELHPAGTCVRVQEGLVAVYSGGEHLVRPGQIWGACPPAVVALPAPAAQERRSEPVARHVLAPRPTPSDLRAQNALFQAALEAQRGGRPAQAARLYRQLLARSPQGPLSTQARANLALVTQ